MVRAVGSLISRKEKNSFSIGITIHLIAGLIFAYAYCYLFQLAPMKEGSVFMGIGGFLGFAHGLVVSYMILIEGQNRHPVSKYRNAGFEVAIAHVVGHVIYGVVVGWAFAMQTITPAASEPGAFTGTDIYQIYMSVVATFLVSALLVMAIRKKRQKTLR